MSDLGIIIPCSAFQKGKSRLSASLDPARRAALCRALLRATVRRALCLTATVLVVSGDAEALSEAESQGARSIDDGGADLNLSLALANAALMTDHDAERRLAVLPIDLPLATPAVLNRAVMRSADVLIAPDRGGDGTNLIILSPALRSHFRFAFGPGSFHHHVSAARAFGCEAVVHRDARIAHDLDTPADLERLRRSSTMLARWVLP